MHGWTYTFGGCQSNFLDCFFLDHSPCPPVTLDVRELQQEDLTIFDFNSTRLKLADGGKIGFEMKGWDDMVGKGTTEIPLRSIQDLWPSALPSRHVFYSYMFRPKYILRHSVYERLSRFNMKGDGIPKSCATFHVRRGDILFHPNQARYYLPLKAYLQAARQHLEILNISTIRLFSDSSHVIEEARRCATDFPNLCGGTINDIIIVCAREISQLQWI